MGGGAGEDQPDPEHVFGSVFEDMLKPEVNRHIPIWVSLSNSMGARGQPLMQLRQTWMGAAAGAAIGFIAGNLPGAAIGGYGGSRLGAVRDAKGKAVYEVFKVRSTPLLPNVCERSADSRPRT